MMVMLALLLSSECILIPIKWTGFTKNNHLIFIIIPLSRATEKMTIWMMLKRLERNHTKLGIFHTFIPDPTPPLKNLTHNICSIIILLC